MLLPRGPPRPTPPAAGRRQRSGCRVDYAYLLDRDRLTVLLNRDDWLPVAEPAWTDRPDWELIDRYAYQLHRWGPP